MNAQIDKISTWPDLGGLAPPGLRRAQNCVDVAQNCNLAGQNRKTCGLLNCKNTENAMTIRQFWQVQLAAKSADQLTRPILQPPQAFRPHLAGLAASQKCRKRKDHSTILASSTCS